MSWEIALDEFEARLVELEDAVLSHEQCELPEWQMPQEPLPQHLVERAEELMARAAESVRLGEEERERTKALITAQSRTTELRGRSEASVLDQRA
jgi:hypothetical protein